MMNAPSPVHDLFTCHAEEHVDSYEVYWSSPDQLWYVDAIIVDQVMWRRAFGEKALAVKLAKEWGGGTPITIGKTRKRRKIGDVSFFNSAECAERHLYHTEFEYRWNIVAYVNAEGLTFAGFFSDGEGDPIRFAYFEPDGGLHIPTDQLRYMKINSETAMDLSLIAEACEECTEEWESSRAGRAFLKRIGVL